MRRILAKEDVRYKVFKDFLKKGDLPRAKDWLISVRDPTLKDCAITALDAHIAAKKVRGL